MLVVMRGGSDLAWLDTDDRQTRRVREAVAALDDKETLDPLGSGSIRDALAEALFPGTSTIQTRLRYFLFVPWICRTVESNQPDRRRFDAQLREHELRLIEALRESVGPDAGVIGYRSGKHLSRMPSSIYWYGLGAWGIRRQTRMSLVQYREAVTARRGIRRLDGDGDAAGLASVIWDPGLPDPPDGFLDINTDLDVSIVEAQYLLDRMAGTRLGVFGGEELPSMLAVVAANATAWRDAAAPWYGPVHALPSGVADLLYHAELFSLAVLGGQLLYNRLLCERARQVTKVCDEEQVAWFDDLLAEWSEQVSQDARLAQWWSQPQEFWATVNRIGARVRPSTKAFLSDWVTAAIRDPVQAAGSVELHRRVVQQEQALKGRYARLSNTAALQAWRGEPVGAYRLEYRWRTVRRLLGDLDDGLRGEGVHAGS